MHAICGGLDLEAFEAGRQAAALALVRGCEAALAALHPDDIRARQWYRSRVDDARTIAGLTPLPGGHLMSVEDDDDEGIGPLGDVDRASG
jgi:hypothetical protein